MNISPKVEPWLVALLEGVQNSNHSAETIASAAYDATRDFVHVFAEKDASTELRVEFRKCLTEVSFTRAGYDVRQMPPAQKSAEAAQAAIGMMRARQIWADNPDKHDILRGVFQDLNPLIAMREIERKP